MKIVDKVKKYAIKLYDKNDITHGWPHILAVRKNALKLQKILGGDKELIEILQKRISQLEAKEAK